MAEGRRILLFDQDGLPRRSLADQLTAQGHEVTQTAHLAEALVQAAQADLLIVDVSLEPAVLCAALREAGLALPVLVLGVAPGEGRELLAAGVSACLAKPVRLSVLASTLETLRPKSAAEQDIALAGFQLQAIARQALDVKGKRIPLTEKETAILVYLHQARDRLVPREELLGEVWGYASAASTHTVETHIYRLRRKLSEAVLITEPGGYRLGD